jgi:hypothetical protein
VFRIEALTRQGGTLDQRDLPGMILAPGSNGATFGLIELTRAATCGMAKFFALSSLRLLSHFHSGADM